MVLQICPALNDSVRGILLGTYLSTLRPRQPLRPTSASARLGLYKSTDVYILETLFDIPVSPFAKYTCIIVVLNGNALASWRTCFRCSLKAEIRQSCWGHRCATKNLQLLFLKRSQGSVTRWGLGPIGAASWNMRMLLGIKTVKVCIKKTDGDLYISLMLQSLLQEGFGCLNSCSKTIWSTRVLHSNYSWLKYCFKLRKVW